MLKFPTILKPGWWLGAVAVVVLLLITHFTDIMLSLEHKAYDLGMHFTPNKPDNRIALIAIDDSSIKQLGAWPWSRAVYANMIDLLATVRPKLIVYVDSFSEPQTNPGLSYISQLYQLYSRSNFKDMSDPAVQQESTRFASLLQEAEEMLNADRKFIRSAVSARNVYLPAYADLRVTAPQSRKPLPLYVLNSELSNVATWKATASAQPRFAPPAARNMRMPVHEIGRAVVGVGTLHPFVDSGGVVRSEPLIVRYNKDFLPSLSLLASAAILDLEPGDIKFGWDRPLRLGYEEIPTDSNLKILVHFYRAENDGLFNKQSFADVLKGKIRTEMYRNKIILIGVTAADIETKWNTPVAGNVSSVEFLGHSISNLINRDFIIVPTWHAWVEYALFTVVGIYLILLLPRLKPRAAVLTSCVFAAIIVTIFFMFMANLIWLRFMMPLALITLGTLLILMKHRMGMQLIESSLQGNRMLAVALQKQGHLDLAYEKFRKCKVDDSLLDQLYNLALEYERRKDLHKAASVFRYIAGYNAKFRDLETRLKPTKGFTLWPNIQYNSRIFKFGQANKDKHTLGDYELEQEISKGAMGTVYLGKHQKTGDVAAIKTLALSKEFDIEELAEVKSRFFLEAETARRLIHPNIVRVFDAGEDKDLAFIVMEYIQGKNLSEYTRPNLLLPLHKVIHIIAQMAEALGYAHKQNVIHRDVKPTNMMYVAETDVAKITDFGIARITDTSRTKTGVILGTPTYMSPEQLAGKRFDGRSDLFSLGITLYQLTCGHLPFQGDSLAQLMFRIANEPPLNIRSFNPDVPDRLVAVLERTLSKQPNDRYRTGDEMAAALRECNTVIVNSVDISL